MCSKLRDAVDHAGLNDFMRVILEPLEEVFHGRGEITISSFTNRRIDIGIPKGRTVTMKLTQGEDRSLAVERLASELMVHVTRLHIDTSLEAVSSALHDLIDQLAPEPAPEPEPEPAQPEPAQPAPAGSGGHVFKARATRRWFRCICSLNCSLNCSRRRSSSSHSGRWRRAERRRTT